MTDTKPSDVDGLEAELDALHVWPQSVADTYADTLTPRQIEKLYAVGDVATRAATTLAAQQADNAAMRHVINEALTKQENDRTLWTPEWQIWASDARAALKEPS